MKLCIISAVIGCLMVGAVAGLTITNKTPAEIHVRVTTTGGGSEDFYDISPGDSETWLRTGWQVAFVLRDDTGETETYVVKPTGDYTVTAERDFFVRKKRVRFMS